jgi:xylan 1,4-beta-xylosidase
MSHRIACLLLAIAAGPCAAAEAPEVAFDWFQYEGLDPQFEEPLQPDHYRNPVLAGFYPDPSVVRVGDDYYLVNSTFAYFPGLPVFHSRDLVHWRKIGHAVNRRGQLTFENGQGISRGLFAPTIRHHDDTFYIINTDVDGIGNFIITAENPAGPWSDPVRLPEIDGIDPDLYFDEDGRVWVVHNGPPEGEPLYQGHRAIWLWAFDLETMALVKGSNRVLVNGGVDISKKPIWIEGPHLYKANGWYYLSCAEGGTEEGHSQVIFRSRSLDEPFIPRSQGVPTRSPAPAMPISCRRRPATGGPRSSECALTAAASTTPAGKPSCCR